MLKWINNNLGKNTPPPAPKEAPKASRTLDPEMLPDNLAGRILDLEFQSETEAINKEMIAGLTCLYIEAVEYYQSRNNDKYKVYHKRMETFLKKTAVDDILRGKSGALVSKRENAEQTINQARNKSKSEVTRIINQTERRANKHKSIISKNLEEQNKTLEQRIHKRRTMSNRSINSERDEDLPEEGITRSHFEEIAYVKGKLHSGRQMGGRKVFI